MLIGARQLRQRARNKAQLRTGMLSNQRSWYPHAGQLDGGLTTERRRGSRWMQTFRKLPTARPSQAKPNVASASLVIAAFQASGTARNPGPRLSLRSRGPCRTAFRSDRVERRREYLD